jgi:xanthine/uracil permease
MKPRGVRESALSLAWTVLAIAALLYVAARLVLAVLPILLAVGGVALAGCLGWRIYQTRRSGW